MPVPSSIVDISTTASSNSPQGSDLIGNTLDEYLRATQAIVKQTLFQGADIASASTITPPASGYSFDVTGTTTITAISSTNSYNGRVIILKFDGSLTLTYNASTLILPTGSNITTTAGDVAFFRQDASGQWRCLVYQYIAGGIGSTWTPSQVSTNTNVDSVSFSEGQYLRVGDTVTASVQITVDATATGDTVVRFSLPITSNLASSFNLGGVGTQNGALVLPSVIVGVYGDATNDCAVIRFSSASTSSVSYLVHFSYKVA